MSDKACLFNLVVYAEKETQENYLNEIIHDIISKYPARVIVISAHDGETKIQKSTFEKSAFPLYEKVTVQLSKKAIHDISLFVLPYLITDYPVYLLYHGNPSKEANVFNSLIKLSNRLIVDSGRSENLNQFVSTMIEQVAKQKIEICDINWARISGWRLILANLFDEHQLVGAASIKLVEITYQNADFLNQAFYLQAWLASSLSLQFVEQKKVDSGLELSYLDGKKQVLIRLISKSKGNGEDAISTVKVTSNANRIYDIKRIEDESLVHVQICTSDACDPPFTVFFPNFHKGNSYLTQLLYSSTSQQYCNMLHHLTE